MSEPQNCSLLPDHRPPVRHCWLSTFELLDCIHHLLMPRVLYVSRLEVE